MVKFSSGISASFLVRLSSVRGLCVAPGFLDCDRSLAAFCFSFSLRGQVFMLVVLRLVPPSGGVFPRAGVCACLLSVLFPRTGGVACVRFSSVL